MGGPRDRAVLKESAITLNVRGMAHPAQAEGRGRARVEGQDLSHF